jgi:hypothetical protein
MICSWVLVLGKVYPRKDNPRTMELNGVCEGCVDVSSKWGIPPKIRGRLFKCLE